MPRSRFSFLRLLGRLTLAALPALPALPALLGLQAPRAFAASPEQEAESALLPFLDVFASPPAGSAHAFLLKGRVESIGSLSFASAPPAFELAVEPPGRLRLQFPLGGSSIIACRNQQQLWASPGQDVQPYLDALASTTARPAGPEASSRSVSPLPPSSPQKALPDLRLPFSGRQLEILPALLQIQPKGRSPLENVACDVVDIRLLPQLAKLLPSEVEGWALRLWLSPQKRPVRIGLQHPLGSAVLRIDHVQFSTSLPSELWQPGADAVSLPASRFEALLKNISRPSETKSPR
jgi:hypothetical protein